MGSLIHELDNDALLMMYLADELSAEDRADVEQLLGVDAGLQAGLVSVRADSTAAILALDVADRIDPPAGLTSSAEAVAIRRVGRAFRQHQVDLLARNRPTLVPERQPVFPSWAYPIGAVAAALLVAVGWWGWERRSAGRGALEPQGGAYAYSQGSDGFGRGWGGGFGGGGGGMRMMIVGDAFGAPGPAGAGSTPGLADAESEASALRPGGDPSELPSLFGDSAAD